MSAAVEVLRVLVAVSLFAVLGIASVSDVRYRKIPNWTVLAVVVLFLPWVLVGPDISLLSSLMAAGIVFLSSICLYALRVIGAGDSKLITAVALFVGLQQLLQFMMLVALVGGMLAIWSLLARPTRTLVMLQLRGQGDFGRGVPYGVAIATAAVWIVAWPLVQPAFG